MELNVWWQGDAAEHYWLEITKRSDIGADLNAPQYEIHSDGSRAPKWSYSLLQEVKDGDVVFHYTGRAIVGWSIADGTAFVDDVVWEASSSRARAAGGEPHVRPGWRVGLRGLTPLEDPIPLALIRQHQSDVHGVMEQLKQQHGTPYYPFTRNNPLKASLAYLTKMPRALIAVIPALQAAAQGADQVREAAPSRGRRASSKREHGSQSVGRGAGLRESGTLGSPYRRADEDSAVSSRDPFEVDPAVVERGLRGHASTQNALADWLLGRGIEARSPSAFEPNFDLAWTEDGVVYVAEVKSLTPENAEKQLRLGLGQLLRYRHSLSQDGTRCVAVLVVELQPPDASWLELLAALDVIVAWPGSFERISAQVAS